jgi:tRNA modification GTPase
MPNHRSAPITSPASARTTIFALSSARGRAAIAVIRVSGPHAAHALKSLTGRVPASRMATLSILRHPSTGAILDQALIIFFKGPASETGEDIAELQVHGGRAVVRSVLEALADITGCRPAEPGEFAHRAFLNGKIDLTAAEGIIDLIDADTEAQRRQAVALAAGEHASLYDGWRIRLIECQALIESAIDFSDEDDVSDAAATMATERSKVLASDISTHLSKAPRGEIIRDGYRIVIAGPPNAGKSTLLNALARRDAAIVSDEAGTTRDAIETHLNLAGLSIICTDTAGIRQTEAKLEVEGIRRTYDRAKSANLIIWLTDIAEPLDAPADLAPNGTPMLTIANKADRHSPGKGDADLTISAATGDGLEALTNHIIAQAQEHIGDDTDLVPTSARQTFHLREAEKHLDDYLRGTNGDIELRAEDLRLAADSLGRITGRIDTEDVLDQIFSRFCIGK